MDMIKELETRKGLLKKLIAAETDEKELEKLNDELIKCVEEMATEKVKAEMAKTAESESLEAIKKEMKAKADTPKIEVIAAGEYNGVNLKRLIGHAGNMKSSIADAAKIDYQAVEKAAKWFTDMTQRAMNNPVQKANVSALTDAQGGYITPTEERMELLAYMKQDSVALRNARVVPMTGDKMTLPKELYNAVVAFRNQEGAVGATSATFSQITVSTSGLDGYVPASKEIVADSPLLIATLMAQFVEATAKKIDSAVFKGGGSPMSGIFTAAAGYSSIFTGANFSSVTAAAIEDICGKVLSIPQDTARLKWYVHPAVFYKYLKGLRAGGSTTTDGPYLFTDPMLSGVPGQFNGFPVEYVYQTISATAASTAMAVLGDLSGVIIGERLNATSMFYDPYTSAANGLDRFFWFTRWGLALAQNNKFGRLRST